MFHALRRPAQVLAVLLGLSHAARAATSALRGRRLTPLNTETEASKIVASDGWWGDRFGHDVALHGDFMVVGAFGVNVLDRANYQFQWDAGAAYVFEKKDDGTDEFQQVAKLVAADGDAYDIFGDSVAISGDVLVVGAPRDDENGRNSGSAYVFKRHPTDHTWNQVAKLAPDNGRQYDNFGDAVAIDGNVIVVGAPSRNSNGADAGAIYIYESPDDGDTWEFTAYLRPTSSTAAFDRVGSSVAVYGDIIVVGAEYDDARNRGAIGSAFVVRRRMKAGKPEWKGTAQLLAGDGFHNDRFGISVAICGDTIVVGAALDDDDGKNSGSAYVFTTMDGGDTWTQSGKLTASDGDAGDQFGTSVAVDGDLIVVGAKNDEAPKWLSGSAYVFELDSASMMWMQTTKLGASDRQAYDYLGGAVSVSGGHVAVGASHEDATHKTDSGSVYVYRRPVEYCFSGVISPCGNVCCASSCGTCGGCECASLPGGAGACCPRQILENGIECIASCDTGCVIDVEIICPVGGTGCD